MVRIKLGDIFEIDTPKGKAYLHYIYKDELVGEMIRVLQGLYFTLPNDLEKLVISQERFIISFPLSSALKQKIVHIVGNYSNVNYKKPKLMRTEFIVKGEFQGWHLVDTDSWQRNLVKTLNNDQKRLSPWGIWNAELLIENISNGWSLENWG